jgi:hypothetical protein
MKDDKTKSIPHIMKEKVYKRMDYRKFNINDLLIKISKLPI